jgi:hypothetical protein
MPVRDHEKWKVYQRGWAAAKRAKNPELYATLIYFSRLEPEIAVGCCPPLPSFAGFEHEAQRAATLIYFSRLEPEIAVGCCPPLPSFIFQVSNMRHSAAETCQSMGTL